ncbi:cell wall protein DAN4-like [Neodiprion lecontei]|uniref:Cell wall protein DAN4-like n=1 Tax=Neodiprion lecontei TaxID=441921 RepID=A0ABM3GQT8_NEOLC|nr:cell wall protein DAN4-like [Neodiprion lecontei]
MRSTLNPGKRLNRWKITLCKYDYEFQHKPGRENVNADALSRNPVNPKKSSSSSDSDVETNVPQQAQVLPLSSKPFGTRKDPTSSTEVSTPETSAGPSKADASIVAARTRSRLRSVPTVPTVPERGEGSSESSGPVARRTRGKVVTRPARRPPPADAKPSGSESESSGPPIQRLHRSMLPSLLLPPKRPKSPPPVEVKPLGGSQEPAFSSESASATSDQRSAAITVAFTTPSNDSDGSTEESEADSMKTVTATLEDSINKFNESLRRLEERHHTKSSRNPKKGPDKTEFDWPNHLSEEDEVEEEARQILQEQDPFDDIAGDAELASRLKALENRFMSPSDQELVRRLSAREKTSSRTVEEGTEADDESDEPPADRESMPRVSARVRPKTSMAAGLEREPDTLQPTRTSVLPAPRHTVRWSLPSNDAAPAAKSTTYRPRASPRAPLPENSSGNKSKFITFPDDPIIIGSKDTNSSLITSSSLDSSSEEEPEREKYIAKTSTIIGSRECLTYKPDNLAHFISADGELSTSVGKLLADLGRVDGQTIKDRNLSIGQIAVTPYGSNKIYSIVIKKRYYDETDAEHIFKGLKN